MSAQTVRVGHAMAQSGLPTSSHPDPTSGAQPREAYGDPWQAFGYLVSGVLFYGVLGWLLDRWLDTRYLVVVGILFGAGLGIYMSFGRFGARGRTAQPEQECKE
jgi:ATP synthase protein I